MTLSNNGFDYVQAISWRVDIGIGSRVGGAWMRWRLRRRAWKAQTLKQPDMDLVEVSDDTRQIILVRG